MGRLQRQHSPTQSDRISTCIQVRIRSSLDQAALGWPGHDPSVRQQSALPDRLQKQSPEKWPHRRACDRPTSIEWQCNPGSVKRVEPDIPGIAHHTKKGTEPGDGARCHAVCNCPDSPPGGVAFLALRRSRAANRWSVGSSSRRVVYQYDLQPSVRWRTLRHANQFAARSDRLMAAMTRFTD